jgi:hypothetical protein
MSREEPSRSDPPGPRPWRAQAITGALLILTGSAALLALLYVTYNESEAAEHLMIGVGLAGSVMISALAQIAIVIGVWLLWRAAHRPRD